MDNLQKYKDLLNKIEENSNTNSFYSSIFPIVMKVAAITISSELLFASKEEIKEVEDRIKVENRNNKIEAVIEGKEYKEKTLEDDSEYIELSKKGVKPLSRPSGILHYIDYKYNDDN
jgi:hypothetical protein